MGSVGGCGIVSWQAHKLDPRGRVCLRVPDRHIPDRHVPDRHCGIVVLWRCGVVALWCCGIVVLWHCGVVALWCCGIADLNPGWSTARGGTGEGVHQGGEVGGHVQRTPGCE